MGGGEQPGAHCPTCTPASQHLHLPNCCQRRAEQRSTSSRASAASAKWPPCSRRASPAQAGAWRSIVATRAVAPTGEWRRMGLRLWGFADKPQPLQPCSTRASSLLQDAGGAPSGGPGSGIAAGTAAAPCSSRSAGDARRLAAAVAIRGVRGGRGGGRRMRRRLWDEHHRHTAQQHLPCSRLAFPARCPTVHPSCSLSLAAAGVVAAGRQPPGGNARSWRPRAHTLSARAARAARRR